MAQNRNICPICGKQKRNPRQKTCGGYDCRGEYAEYRTKKRVERQKMAEPFIRNCEKTAKERMQKREICVVCGEFLEACLTTHHFDRKQRPKDVVTMCASCHRIFDSSVAGLRELRVRRERYYDYNLKLIHRLADENKTR